MPIPSAIPPVDWTTVRRFGERPSGVDVTVRPSAYAIVPSGDRVAIVIAPLGTYLPGGGIDAGESPIDAVIREAREECGFIVRVDQWCTHAVDIVYSRKERRHFEKLSTFVEASIVGHALPTEIDHVLEWMTVNVARERLIHPSHRWALDEWCAAR